jgi:outer membrane immunogenic protein
MIGNTPAVLSRDRKRPLMRCLSTVLSAAFCAWLCLGGLSTPARAADYDLPTLRGTETQFVPAFPRYFNWEGVYVGGQLAYANSGADFNHATQPLFAIELRNLEFEAETGVSNTQVLGATDTGSAGFGGFVGYNMQFDTTVLGFEFNYTHTNLNAIAPDFPIGRMTGVLKNNHAYAYLFDGSGSLRTTDVGLLQARAGYVMDRFMPFLSWGIAVGRADAAVSVSCSCQEFVPATPPATGLVEDADFSFSRSESKSGAYLWGYTGGGGLEMALTQNIFGRLDYEYVQWSHVFGIVTHVHLAHVGVGVKF